jgi:hypothetical protein
VTSSIHNTDTNFSSDQIDRLLDAIPAPPNRTGRADAIVQLLASARTLASLAPSSILLNKLLLILEGEGKQHLKITSPARDQNEMRGLYQDYPLYSLFIT